MAEALGLGIYSRTWALSISDLVAPRLGISLSHKGLLLLKFPCQSPTLPGLNKREVWGWLRPFPAWTAEMWFHCPIHSQPCASCFPSMAPDEAMGGNNTKTCLCGGQNGYRLGQWGRQVVFSLCLLLCSASPGPLYGR